MSLIRTAAAARMLGVKPDTLRDWNKKGLLKPVVLPSGQVRYRKDDIESIINQQKAQKEEL